MTYLIDATDVVVSYPMDDGGRKVVVNDVNFKVRSGELVTVVGPSGCGKSTLLRLVLGSQMPTQGSVLVDGSTVKRITRDCGIVYQDYSLFPHLTVLDNIAMGLIIEQTGLLERWAFSPLIGAQNVARSLLGRFGMEPGKASFVDSGYLNFIRYLKVRGDAHERAFQFLENIGLKPGDGDKYPFELSGGMRQRVAIAQALIMRPKILLMDEPFGALDTKTRESMQDFLHEKWSQHGLTVFFVTHDLDEAVVLGTRLICLSQYWAEDDGTRGIGAKIVVDRKVLGGAEKPSSFHECAEFRDTVYGIRQAGLDDSHLQPMAQFDLSHEDALV